MPVSYQPLCILRPQLLFLGLLVLLLVSSGCTQMISMQGNGALYQGENSPAGINENRDANPRRAANSNRRHLMKANEKAIRLILRGKPEKARRALGKIVDRDEAFGPAQNNLGQLYFDQGDYFLAAERFMLASQLMPDRTEPLYNLGMVYEATDRLAEAVNMYETARDIDPVDPRPLGNLVRVLLTIQPYDLATEPLLKELLTIEYREPWREWAGNTLAHLRSKSRSKSRSGESSESNASNDNTFIISDEPPGFGEGSIVGPAGIELLPTPAHANDPFRTP